MNIKRITLQAHGRPVPAVEIIPAQPRGGAVLVHGYGGCKEELLGLAWRVAEQGLAVCTIDLPGHGENKELLSENVLMDVEAALESWRRFGKVLAIGQSLGGRLALSSSADFVIAISPPLAAEVGRSLRVPLKNMRSHRVTGTSFDQFLEIFRVLPKVQSDKTCVLIIIGGRDFKEVADSCLQVEERGIPVKVIDKALHSDVYVNEDTFSIIDEQIGLWFA